MVAHIRNLAQNGIHIPGSVKEFMSKIMERTKSIVEEELRRRLTQIHRMSVDGKLGVEIQRSAQEYQQLSDGMSVFLKIIRDFYQQRETEGDRRIHQIADLFSQLIIVVYRDCKQKDANITQSIIDSFIKDFPGIEGTCLFSRWDSLGKAALAYKAAVQTKDANLVWQQAKDVVLAYNEFLNGLLGFLLVGWRCALGKHYSINTFNNAYGAKLNEFSQLTGGENGAFYLICRLGRPHLRNAIAHRDIWLDTDENKVRYKDGRKTKTDYEMGLEKFVHLATIGTHLPQAYLVAIASIVILEEGSAVEKDQIPSHLIKMFGHRVSKNDPG
jgi:hypothetical protein